MSDYACARVMGLPGEPEAWRASVREYCRHLRAESPTREAALEWWLDGRDDPDRPTAEDRLDFLEAAGVVERESGTCRPGPHGREFLDTHDEGVLYEALTGAFEGFEPLLEALAVRPVTDVELADLLERELGPDVDATAAALARRRWLQALGYVTHDDGVVDLTRAGRRRVQTDDALTAPNERASARPPDAAATTDAASNRSPVISETDRSKPTNGADEPAYKAELRRRYDHTCAICGDRRRTGEGGHSCVHHLMPLGNPHGGPAVPENAVVVCPNHRADLEHGLVTVDPQTLEVTHAYEPDVDGQTLRSTDDHEPGAQYLAYYDGVVADF